MKIICTICSRRKIESSGLLPAKERYTGDHISKVKDFSIIENIPFYILSGKYGLIPGAQKIPYYDYYLEEIAVNGLIETVSKQIQEEKITEIDFYMEDKVSWSPYLQTIKKASEQIEIKLNIKQLLE